MTTYDAEDLCQSILEIMTTNEALNAKIEAIDAEKAAKGMDLSPALQTISEECYHLQTWSEKILQKTPAIFYGVEDVIAVDGGGVVAKTYTIFVEVIMVDNGQTNDVHKRIMRYSRALEELFRSAYAPAIAVNKLKVASVRPISFKLELDSDDEIKVGGVSLTIPLV